MDVFILNENDTDAARAGLLRLHDAVGRREPGRPEAALSPDELLSRFRAADPTRNAACLPWLLRTYAAGGYRLEDLSKAYDTLAAFTRLRGLLPDTATIDSETRNPRKLGSHVTLASLWTVIAPLIEAERLAQEDEADEKVDSGKELALSQSRVIYRSNRMVVAVPMTVEASCWWGQGTQWCTAARKNNAFEHYHKKAPLIVVCLRRVGDLPALKLQLHVHAGDMQFMDENDARVSQKIILERWQDLEEILHWAVAGYGLALKYVPDSLRTKAICTSAVGSNGMALAHVPEPLRTEEMCTVAVGGNGRALEYVPDYLRTEAICLAAVGSNGWALYCVPESLRTEVICLVAVGSNGQALQYVPEPLRTEAICTSAVGSNGRALYYVPNPLRTEAMCLAAVAQNGFALEYVPKPLCTETLCLAALVNNGLALSYVPEPLRTEAICTSAVGSNGRALYYVPDSICTKAMCITAVSRNGVAIAYVPKHLRSKEICLAASDKDIQKSISTTRETNERESHDLALAGLEGYLNDLYPSHQNTNSTINPVMHQ